jgi:hypothetical protein
MWSVSSFRTHQARYTSCDRIGGAHMAATTPAVYLKPAEKFCDLLNMSQIFLTGTISLFADGFES